MVECIKEKMMLSPYLNAREGAVLYKLLIIIAFSIFFVKIILKYAHKLDLYDVPNERSHHCVITPSGAGIGFVSSL